MQHAVFFNPAEDGLDDVLDSVERVYLATEGVTASAAPATPNVIPAGAPAGATPVPQAAAAALVPAAPQAAAAVQRDADGLPHDERIHTVPAKIGSNGKWAAKRKLDAAFVSQVIAELRGAAPTPAAAPAPQQQQLQAPAALTAPASLTPPAAAMTGYQELCALFGKELQTATNPNGKMPESWARQSLSTWGVPNGQLEAAATMPDDHVRQMVAAIRTALGL